MAWLVSVKLHPFLTPPQVVASQMEIHQKMSAHCVVSSLRPKRVAINILLSASASKQTTALSKDNYHVTLSSFRQLFSPVSKLSHVSYSPRTLTGYWIGPDTEDGWGFAEAFIDEIR